METKNMEGLTTEATQVCEVTNSKGKGVLGLVLGAVGVGAGILVGRFIMKKRNQSKAEAEVVEAEIDVLDDESSEK